MKLFKRKKSSLGDQDNAIVMRKYTRNFNILFTFCIFIFMISRILLVFNLNAIGILAFGTRKKVTVSDEEFKPFRETYKIITFTMIAGMLYPTPETDRCRAVGIVVIILSVVPISIVILLDIWRSWLEGDIINIIRHGTIIGPFFAALLKMILFFIHRDKAFKIITAIDKDYARYNTLPEDHKVIARHAVSESVYYSEKCWAVTVVAIVQTFPLTAIILNLYNFSSKSEPTKYMVHDVNKPFSEPEARFESPFFEIMFFYMVYCSFLYILSFIGYDAFFGVTINHVCLKMELFCKELEDAMTEYDFEGVFKRMVEVIRQQKEVFRIVEILQETFNTWLGTILVATIIQICNCMYQIIEGYGIDLRYLVFVSGAIVHIYLPCRYASKMQASALEVATKIYCCGWEQVYDERIRKMIVFMIARAQMPMNITAFNMFTFDMELFVSILQTSYSMFTLLRP